MAMVAFTAGEIPGGLTPVGGKRAGMVVKQGGNEAEAEHEDKIRSPGRCVVDFFKKGRSHVTMVPLNEGVAIDLWPGEEVVGIEVLDASDHLELDPKAAKVVLEKLQAG